MTAYYNENNPHAAAWLRDLIKRGLIPDGVVDTRSIVDVVPDELVGYDQVHLFAGIGGWPLALQLAGVGDLRCWTGSCPCQPFSNSGLLKGANDERHLWPHMLYLVAACRPATIFGEQVESKAGRNWLGCVRSDLESLAYDVGASDLPAAGVGADHARQRLYWFADSSGERWYDASVTQAARDYDRLAASTSIKSRSPGGRRFAEARTRWLSESKLACVVDGLSRELAPIIRGYGNAIVPPLAAEFIAASLEAITDTNKDHTACDR